MDLAHTNQQLFTSTLGSITVVVQLAIIVTSEKATEASNVPLQIINHSC